MQLMRFLGFLGLCALAGCSSGGPTLTPVSGTITLGGEPLANAIVRFIPEGETKGHGGNGKSGADGKYEIIANRENNRKGLIPGEYRVAVSLLPAGAKPIETGEKELVPEPYSNPRESPLRAIVETSAKPFDFAINKK